MTKKRRRISDQIIKGLIVLSALLSILLLLLIIVFVVSKGIGQVNWDFLTTVTSVRKGTIGIAGNIFNTILIIVLTMLFTIPIGVGAAIFLNEYAGKGKIVTVIEFATEVLSGIPSIIFGLFGMMFFVETLGLGYCILSGALTLILMVLPLVIRNTQEALKTVPDGYRQGAIGLGAGKWYDQNDSDTLCHARNYYWSDSGNRSYCRGIGSTDFYSRICKATSQRNSGSL